MSATSRATDRATDAIVSASRPLRLVWPVALGGLGLLATWQPVVWVSGFPPHILPGTVEVLRRFVRAGLGRLERVVCLAGSLRLCGLLVVAAAHLDDLVAEVLAGMTDEPAIGMPGA